MTISIGGEIGEVGKSNSTEAELRAYLDTYRNELAAMGDDDMAQISKVSIQTGTSHGGVPLPDGSIAQVKIDFDTMRRLSTVARDEYGLAGCVQHGASTLPEEAFGHFPANGTAEIHLATGFQNILYDGGGLPADLHAEMMAWCVANCADERKDGETEEQFLYKTRKKAIGPFKRRLWELPAERPGGDRRPPAGEVRPALRRTPDRRHARAGGALRDPGRAAAAAAGRARRRGGGGRHGRRIGLRGRRLRGVAAALQAQELPQHRLVGEADEAPRGARRQVGERLERAGHLVGGQLVHEVPEPLAGGVVEVVDRREQALDRRWRPRDDHRHAAVEALHELQQARRAARAGPRAPGRRRPPRRAQRSAR